VYQRIAAELLPTPTKSHYTFNLRDLSKVMQGMLLATPKTVTDVDTLLRLWCHEAARVFQVSRANVEASAMA
jgi:dynein heavy chain